MEQGSKPLKEFMLKQTRESDLAFFVELKRKSPPKSPDELTMWEIAPAYILSELKANQKESLHIQTEKILAFLQV